MTKTLFLTSLLILPSLLTAKTVSYSKHHNFLTTPFIAQDVAKCHRLLQTCPKAGPLPKASCEAMVVKKHPYCQSLKKLADALNSSMTLLAAQQIDQFTIITQHYIADGQLHYYILTPTGDVVDTQVDPRQLRATLRKQYAKASWVISNSSRPDYLSGTQGRHAMRVALGIKQDCVACKTIGFASVTFHFNKKGGLQGATLDAFNAVK